MMKMGKTIYKIKEVLSAPVLQYSCKNFMISHTIYYSNYRP